MKIIKLFFFFIFPISIFSQSNLDFEFDYAQFAYDSSSNYVEFYYSYNQSTMKVNETDSGKTVNGILHIAIIDTSSGANIVDKKWSVAVDINEGNSLNQSLIGVVGFILPEGNLKTTITGIDANDTESKKSITDYIQIKPLFSEHVTISDIQLASKMIKESQNVNSVFYKNTYEIMPVPNLVFGEEQPVLFFYSELYNLQNDTLQTPLKMLQILSNSRNQKVDEKTKYISRKVDSRVEVGSFLLNALPTDSYTITIALIDSAGNYGVSSSKKFYVYNPSVEYIESPDQTEFTDVLSSPFGSMSEEELDDMYLKSGYIATQQEKDRYELLENAEGKRKFLFEFWKSRDSDPSTPQNESYFEYLRRIEESNAKYTSISKPGWKTDRGRVLIIYGEPTEIERYPNEPQTRPYEIWQYQDLEGGVFFVFADLTGFSSYQLLHSNKRGEIRDDNWSRRIVVQ